MQRRNSRRFAGASKGRALLSRVGLRRLQAAAIRVTQSPGNDTKKRRQTIGSTASCVVPVCCLLQLGTAVGAELMRFAHRGAA